MMGEPRFWNSRFAPASLALLPLSAIYGALEFTRRAFAQPQHPGKPVICVGNLTAGGAGKTPSVNLLLRWLAEDGFKPAVLSRGYGGQEKGPLKVDPAHHTARQVGDEPLMLAGDNAVYICADRMAALRLAVADGHDVLVKDDGFQNPAMAHHFNLIVIDGASGLGNERLLPAGPLRQSVKAALKKIDALLIIGQPSHHSLPPLRAQLEAVGKPVFHAEIIAAPMTLSTQKPVHGFCGIAKPEKFRTSLAQAGYALGGFTSFSDHHEFSEAEAQKLVASDLPLVTTQKDMARLQGAPAGSARAELAATAHVLKIDLAIADEDELRGLIKNALAAKQANQIYKSY
jgi:tetraacyldisaccharide 4'-kinase